MEFIRNNAIQIIGLVFAAGITFSEARSLHGDVDTLERQMEKHLEEYRELETRVLNLEKCNH